MGPDRVGRDRAEPVDLSVSPGEVAGGMGSALATDWVCVLWDECSAPSWSSLHYPECDVPALTPKDRRMNHTTPQFYRRNSAIMRENKGYSQ